MVMKLDPGHLSSLGLKSFDLGEQESFAIPEENITWGKPSGATIGLAALLATTVAPESFAEVPSRTASSLGISLSLHDENPLLLLAASNEEAQIFVGTPDQDCFGYPEGEQTRVLVDLSSGPITLATSGDTELVVAGDAREIRLFQATQPSPSVSIWPKEKLAPLTAWADACADNWLADQLRHYAEQSDPWSTAVGAAMKACLYQPSSPQEAQEIIQKTIAGEVIDRIAEPHRWMAGLFPEDRDALALEALQRIERLRRELRSLRQTLDIQSLAWRERLQQLAVERADIDEVVFLLKESGLTGDNLPLAPLDSDGEQFITGLPYVLTFENERLSRSAHRRPEAWWNHLAKTV